MRVVGLNPELAALVFSATSSTSTPFWMPTVLALALSKNVMPMMGRLTRPFWMIVPTTVLYEPEPATVMGGPVSRGLGFFVG